MAEYARALNKQTAVARMYELAGVPPEPLGPGSKEKKSCLVALASVLSLDVSGIAGKPQVGAAIAAAVGVNWDDSCWSTGDSITLTGLNTLLEGTATELTRRNAASGEELVLGEHIVGLAPDTYDTTGSAQSSAIMTTTPNDVQGRENHVTEEQNAEIDEDRADSEATIAELMATLSQATETPTEVKAHSEPFVNTEVRFSDGSWMARLVEIQGWLRLPESIDTSTTQAFLSSLLTGLGIENPQDALEQRDGEDWLLSHLGFERLRERLDRAVELQDTFQESLDAEGGSLKSATALWGERWDESIDEEERESSGSIVAKSDVWPISDFRSHANKGKLNLSPSYQRADVWPTTDSQMLMESILRGIPLPSIILLKFEEESKTKYEVVDGKQRLTSILRFIGKHPKALERVASTADQHGDKDLMHLFENNYPKFRKVWANLTGDQLTATKEREYYFPFRLRTNSTPLSGDLKHLQGKYYSEIRDSDIRIADEACEVSDVFETNTDYKLPVIEYSKAKPQQIQEVFNLYNKQGKHLNAEEIRNALFHRLDLMRALLVASGDSEDMENVAPFLEPVWTQLSSTHKALDLYRFGTTRYKRTKLLSWVASILFFDTIAGGQKTMRSTARQIDALLDRVNTHRDDPFRADETVQQAMLLLHRGIEAHSAIPDAWAPGFMDSNAGAKWQELQLVGSLVGVILATSVLGDEIADRLEDAAATLAARSGQEWRRPTKTQTASQWWYIADVALGVLEVLGVTPDDADEEISKIFTFSGVKSLQAVRSSDKPY